MALVANSSQAVAEYTAQARTACGVGARQMSTTPAISAAGTIPAWSQPRNLGLIGSARSAACSTRAAAEGVFPLHRHLVIRRAAALHGVLHALRRRDCIRLQRRRGTRLPVLARSLGRHWQPCDHARRPTSTASWEVGQRTPWTWSCPSSSPTPMRHGGGPLHMGTDCTPRHHRGGRPRPQSACASAPRPERRHHRGGAGEAVDHGAAEASSLAVPQAVRP